VVKLRLVNGKGTISELSGQESISLGALGIASTITLRVIDMYWLKHQVIFPNPPSLPCMDIPLRYGHSLECIPGYWYGALHCTSIALLLLGIASAIILINIYWLQHQVRSTLKPET
jgi:hypothetical protein